MNAYDIMHSCFWFAFKFFIVFPIAIFMYLLALAISPITIFACIMLCDSFEFFKETLYRYFIGTPLEIARCIIDE